MSSKKSAAAMELGRLGGKARARALSPEERSKQASKAAKMKTRSMTKEQRSALARAAAKARWAKKKA